MSFREPHELHKRRSGRNIGLGLVLAAFIAIVFGLTIVKVTANNAQLAAQQEQQNQQQGN